MLYNLVCFLISEKVSSSGFSTVKNEKKKLLKETYTIECCKSYRKSPVHKKFSIVVVYILLYFTVIKGECIFPSPFLILY